jgi:hypothetical protein
VGTLKPNEEKKMVGKNERSWLALGWNVVDNKTADDDDSLWGGTPVRLPVDEAAWQTVSQQFVFACLRAMVATKSDLVHRQSLVITSPQRRRKAASSGCLELKLNVGKPAKTRKSIVSEWLLFRRDPFSTRSFIHLLRPW